MHNNEAIDQYLSILTKARSAQPTGPLPDDVNGAIISTLCREAGLFQPDNVPLSSDGPGLKSVDTCSNSDK